MKKQDHKRKQEAAKDLEDCTFQPDLDKKKAFSKTAIDLNNVMPQPDPNMISVKVELVDSPSPIMPERKLNESSVNRSMVQRRKKGDRNRKTSANRPMESGPVSKGYFDEPSVDSIPVYKPRQHVKSKLSNYATNAKESASVNESFHAKPQSSMKVRSRQDIFDQNKEASPRQKSPVNL